MPATMATASAAMPLLQYPDVGAAGGHTSGGYYQRSKRKHGHAQKFLLGRHGRVAAAASVLGSGNGGGSAWSNIRFEDVDEQQMPPHQYVDEYDDGEFVENSNSNNNENDNNDNADEELVDDMVASAPHTQMVYSNMIYKNHLDNRQQQQQQLLQPQHVQHTHQQQQQQQQYSAHQHPQQGRMAGGIGGGLVGGGAHDMLPHGNQFQLAERKRLTAALHKKQHHRPMAGVSMTTQPPPAPPLNNVYSYHIDSYDSFGAISCVASNAMGQSEPCWYHIQPAGECATIANILTVDCKRVGGVFI